MASGGVKKAARIVAEAEEVEDGVEEGAEISREVSAATPFETRNERREYPKLTLRDDGSLSREKAEKYCLHLVDGLVPTEAWKAAGGQNTGRDQYAERRAYEADPVFQDRWERLLWEKRADTLAGPHGEAMYAARMAFRTARLSGDAGQVLRAAELIARVADKMAPVAEGGAAVAGEARPVGRPAAEAKQTKVNVGALRQGLIDKGLPAPAMDEEIEPVGTA